MNAGQIGFTRAFAEVTLFLLIPVLFRFIYNISPLVDEEF
jgi:hypothetical protein